MLRRQGRAPELPQYIEGSGATALALVAQSIAPTALGASETKSV